MKVALPNLDQIKTFVGHEVLPAADKIERKVGLQNASVCVTALFLAIVCKSKFILPTAMLASYFGPKVFMQNQERIQSWASSMPAEKKD
ncbi:MAG: hypothetical protein JXA94_02935 [Parachlamydiales bacterium]|nr:hypothetical protein [Parachlamydiales bacterium]